MQSTRVRVLASWSNGVAADTLSPADVTALGVALATNDTSAASVAGAVVQGVAVPASLPQVAVRVTLAGSALTPAPSTTILVSNSPVCLVGLAPLAATSASWGPVGPPGALDSALLSWQPRQDLVWEGVTAPVSPRVLGGAGC